jgi:Mg-chelatase subunit ChlD
LATGYVTDRAVVVLLTDGHANVPTRTADAWADAQAAARALGCPGLVIDTEDRRSPTGRPRQLADIMNATYVRIDEVDQTSVLRVIRALS